MLGAFDAGAEIGVEAMRGDAQPIVGIEEGQAPLEDMVDLDPEAARGRGEIAAAADIFAVAVERLEEHRVGEADDQQALEIGVGGGVLEQGQRAGAVDRELHRAGAGQLLEPVEIGVEQDARIADDRDRLRFPSGRAP